MDIFIGFISSCGLGIIIGILIDECIDTAFFKNYRRIYYRYKFRRWRKRIVYYEAVQKTLSDPKVFEQLGPKGLRKYAKASIKVLQLRAYYDIVLKSKL